MITRRALAGASAGLLLPASLRAQGTKVEIGFVPGTDFVPALIAQDKGYFAKDGMDAHCTIIPLISNIPAALVSGSLQIGATTGPIFLQAQENGIDLVAVAGATRWTPEAQTVSLVVAQGSDVKSPADLKGKRVAVPGLNSLMDLTFRRWLVMKGVDPKSVTKVEASFPSMGDLLRNHQVDAALIIEPFRDFALSSGAGTRMSDFVQEVNKNFLAAFYIAERRWAEANPKMIVAFRDGIRQGTDTFLHDPAGREIEKKYFKVNAKVVPAFSMDVTADDLRFHEDLCRQFGLLNSNIDPSRLILN
jgi:NitT/TauT family transport system substrate-binding protein